MFLALLREVRIRINALLPHLLALSLHSNGDLLPAAFDILDERAQNTMDRLTVQRRRWEHHPTGPSVARESGTKFKPASRAGQARAQLRFFALLDRRIDPKALEGQGQRHVILVRHREAFDVATRGSIRRRMDRVGAPFDEERK